MTICYHKQFSKNYKRRIAKNRALVKQFQRQLQKFLVDSTDPSLRDHKLIGKKKNFRAFSVTGDIRVIYLVRDDELWLFDIGTHNQVY